MFSLLHFATEVLPNVIKRRKQYMFWADFRIKLGRLFRKYRKIILIVLIIWLCVLVVNSMLKDYKPEEKIDTTYTPHESVLGSKEDVPQNLQQPIDELIETYFNYCQNKEYENAYNMVSDNCKNIYFNSLDSFKEYVDIIFDQEKLYYIQNYSNYDNYYIYQIRIFDNIMKTGLTGKEDITFYEEKLVISKEDNGELKLSLRQYITSKNMEDVYEDDYLKIWVEKKHIFYEQETYTLKIKNKSEYIAVLADSQEAYEVLLSVGSQTRDASNDNLSIVIQPNETNLYNLNFVKFYDETYLSNGLIFNAVRILKTYTGLELTKEAELKSAEQLYSIQIPF